MVFKISLAIFLGLFAVNHFVVNPKLALVGAVAAGIAAIALAVEWYNRTVRGLATSLSYTSYNPLSFDYKMVYQTVGDRFTERNTLLLVGYFILTDQRIIKV